MPRQTRAFGRPGTPVIPTNWERDHAPVVAKTLTAKCKIWAPASTPSIKADLSYDPPAGATPLYDGACRIQVLNNVAMDRLFGDEYQSQTGYLVVIDREEDDVARGGVVEVYRCSDPTLLEDGRRLVVAKVDRGSLRFERDLYCTDQALG